MDVASVSQTGLVRIPPYPYRRPLAFIDAAPPSLPITTEHYRLISIQSRGWTTAVWAAFQRLGIVTWGDLERCSMYDLGREPGVNYRSVDLVVGELTDRGLSVNWNGIPDGFVMRLRRPSKQGQREQGAYFIQCEEFVKIGYSNHIGKRLQTFRMGVPFTARILAIIPCASMTLAQSVERELHRIYEPQHVRGEWFTLAPPLSDFIARTGNDGTD